MTTSTMRLGVATCQQNAAAKQLIRRFYRQIGGRSATEHEALCGTYAISFRPGDRTGSFLGKHLRPLGQSVMVVLSYGQSESGRPTMPLRGYRAQVSADGSVSYGVEDKSEFLYNAALRPHLNIRGRGLNPFRNASLFHLMLQMDTACQRQLARPFSPAIVPRFPRILLGFATNDIPAFEDTPALRRMAAKQLGVSIQQLGTNGEELLERLLHNVWEEQLRWPGAEGNDTDLVLVDAELCTHARKSLRVFEDFRGLVGTYTWNPARAVAPVQIPNPAGDVRVRFGLEQCPDLGQVVTQDVLPALELAVREHLGTAAEMFTTEEIYDGILSPQKLLTAWNHALLELRSKLDPVVSECTTDEDLLRATECPEEPLFASGACRIQVLGHRSPIDQEAFHFSSADLDRRIEANLWDERWSVQPSKPEPQEVELVAPNG